VYAEPLEGAPEEARFRFADCGGVDPWTPGQLAMIHTSLQRGTGARRCLGTTNGVVVPSTTGVLLYPTTGSSTSLSSKTTITGPITANDTTWYGASGTAIEYGLLAGGGEGATALTGITAMVWAKDRLWVGAGKNLHEITSLAPPTLPTTPITFRGGNVVDIDQGAGSVYVMVTGAFTSIFMLSVSDDGTLTAPREVATLPRGETGVLLYGYLGRYLAVGTTKGLRIADCSDASTLALGPVIIEMTGGCRDVVGDGQYLYATTGTEGISPDGYVRRPGLYRVDLSNPVNMRGNFGDSAASRFPYAPDLYQPGAGTLAGQSWSVTAYGGRIWYVCGTSSSSATLYRTDDAYSTTGWLDSGLVSFSTAERKAWLSFSLDVAGGGGVYLEADTGTGVWAPATGSVLTAPRLDSALALDTAALPAASSIRHRVTLSGDGTAAGSPRLLSLGLRALPVPHRTRYLQMPLLCFDRVADRNNNTVGYQGWAADVLADLEGLESSGLAVNVTDHRTGEVLRCLIDKVSFTTTTPPSRSFTGMGGVIILTLLAV
jgi:hypothetical protein